MSKPASELAHMLTDEVRVTNTVDSGYKHVLYKLTHNTNQVFGSIALFFCVQAISVVSTLIDFELLSII